MTKNAWLYELKRADSDLTSYLFGTMHLVCQEQFVWPDKILYAVENCRVLYLEVDLSNTEELSGDLDLLDCNSVIKDKLTESQWQTLCRINNTTLKYSENELANLHPFILLVQLQNHMFDCEVICPERELMEIALQKGLEVRGLESSDVHLQTIGQVALQDYLTQLQDILDHYEEYKKLFHALTDCYYRGDAEKMNDFFKRHSRFVLPKTAEEAFLVKRNKSWLPVIERSTINTPAVFAVGAAHLIGEHGLLSLLSKDGFILRNI